MAAKRRECFECRNKQYRPSGHKQHVLGEGVVDRCWALRLVQAKNAEVGTARVPGNHDRCHTIDAVQLRLQTAMASRQRMER